MESLLLLRQKIELLIREHSGVKAALATANKTLAAKDVEIEQIRTQLKTAEERLLALEIGKAIPDAKSRASSRRQLDAVIGEIDKILTTLHD